MILKPSINNNTSTNKAPERPMSFTVSIPSRLSGLIETNNDGNNIKKTEYLHLA